MKMSQFLVRFIFVILLWGIKSSWSVNPFPFFDNFDDPNFTQRWNVNGSPQPAIINDNGNSALQLVGAVNIVFEIEAATSVESAGADVSFYFKGKLGAAEFQVGIGGVDPPSGFVEFFQGGVGKIGEPATTSFAYSESGWNQAYIHFNSSDGSWPLWYRRPVGM